MEKLENRDCQELLMQNWSTLKFIGFCILTLNVTYFIWIWKIINKLGNQEAQAVNRGIAVALFAIVMWADSLEYLFDETIYSDDLYIYLSSLIGLIVFIIPIIITFKLKPLVEDYLISINKPYRLSTLWCIVFEIYYLYYILYNIDYKVKYLNASSNEDNISKLEKLQHLKEGGAITDEEFQIQKNKLLNDN